MKKHFNNGHQQKSGGWEADLQRALRNGDIKSVKRLVDAPPPGRNITELRKAAHSGNVAQVKRLLDNPQTPEATLGAPKP